HLIAKCVPPQPFMGKLGAYLYRVREGATLPQAFICPLALSAGAHSQSLRPLSRPSRRRPLPLPNYHVPPPAHPLGSLTLFRIGFRPRSLVSMGELPGALRKALDIASEG